MRASYLATALLVAAAPAIAADALPDGWTQRDDGAYIHTTSTAICPTELGGLKRTQLAAKGAPDFGICTYTGEQEREGLIRVRQYVRGEGETPLAIQNDKMLIEPPPGSPNVVAGQRVGPGPERNGAPTQQFVITITRNGLLIDCVSRRLKGDQGDIATDFALACMKIQDPR